MNLLQRYTNWLNNQQSPTDAEMIVFANIKIMCEQSSSYNNWWIGLSAQQKQDALDNMVRVTDRNLDVLFKPEARFS